MTSDKTLSLHPKTKSEIKESLQYVYDTLKKKGYNPTLQIAGFLASGDLSYITSSDGARNFMARIDRFDVLEYLIEESLK